MGSIWDTKMASETTKSTLSRYYEALDAGDLDGLASCFAADAVLLVPGRPERGGELRAKNGQPEILEFFRRRGVPGDRHTVTAVAEVDGRCLVEGVLSGPADDAAQPFLASVRFAADGRIAHYLVFSAPGPAEFLSA